MNLVIHIPKWLLWTLGVPAVIALLGLAILGASFLWAFRNGWGR